MVLICHLEYQGDIVGNSRMMYALGRVLFTGWAGVDLFFVLSGFLITGILLDTSSAANRWTAFYMRRVLRIFPLYYLAIAGMVFVAPLFPALMPYYPSTTGWISYLAYIQNWYIPVWEPTHAILAHFWSLGVEEQFYLVWPACVWLIPRKRLAWTCVAGCVIALTLRCAMLRLNMPSDVILMNTVTRMDALLCGGFCAIAVRDGVMLGRIRAALPYVLAVVVIGMFLIEVVAREVGSRGIYTLSVGFTLLATGFGSLVMYAYLNGGRDTIFARTLSWSPLRAFGRYSYGIYVYHGIVFFTLNSMFRVRGWLFSGLLILTTFAVATLSFHAFENQFLKLKSRFRPVTG